MNANEAGELFAKLRASFEAIELSVLEGRPINDDDLEPAVDEIIMRFSDEFAIDASAYREEFRKRFEEIIRKKRE